MIYIDNVNKFHTCIQLKYVKLVFIKKKYELIQKRHHRMIWFDVCVKICKYIQVKSIYYEYCANDK